MKYRKINHAVLGVLTSLFVSTACAETAAVTALPQSCAGEPNALPCQLSFSLNSRPAGETVYATVGLPVQISGSGLEPCLKLSLENPDGTRKPVADVTVRKDTTMAIFCITSFLREHAGETNFPLYVEQVSGPCVTVQATGRPATLDIDAETTPPCRLVDILGPVWETPRMINETVLPVSVDGGLAQGKLLYTPDGKVTVRNYALDKTYQENTDYVIDGNTIRLPAGSSIPSKTWKQLYPDSADAPPATKAGLAGGYVAFTEGSFWNDCQTAVSYDHAESWKGPVPPAAASGQLLLTKEKLRSGQPLKVVLFGDSISAGASASRFRPPHVPGWGWLAMEGLHLKYRSEITFLNPSLGGTSSWWGQQTAPFFVAPEKPDLCMIAFGMNDGGHVPVEQYLANTKAIIESVRKENPDTEFILVASWPPNENWRSLKPMDGYLDALKTLESPQIVVADVWSVASYMLQTKRYCDITGNHLNHPNDFMVRVYAQVVNALFGEK
jgi:lysophospholipase L1-like esterase